MTIEVQLTSMAHGGAAVGRVDGKAHFVDGALPGETIRGTLGRDAGSWASVDLLDVVEASPERITPPCAHFGACGGCQWQYATHEAQQDWKRAIVTGQLAHIGDLHDIDVRETVVPSEPFGYRNRMDFKVVDGSPAMTRRKSHSTVPIEECLLLHPMLKELFDALGPLPGVRSLTLRAGVNTGERLVVVGGTVPESAGTWDASVAHRTGNRLRRVRGSTEIHEVVQGHRLRITGTAFFQANTDGAEALVGLVRDALDPLPTDVLLDAYAGGGLFGATIGGSVSEVIAIEVAAGSVTDLVHNLEAADVKATVVEGNVEQVANAAAPSVDIVVADPPRRGLRAEGVDALVTLAPRTIAYVSCDPASLARDARMLTAAGYELDRVTPVDMFPQTFHTEAVARFTAIGTS